MATIKQIENLHKCPNKYRHRWIDKGREKNGIDTYDYYCKFCEARRIKCSAYHMEYRTKGNEETLFLAPECEPITNEKGEIINLRKRRYK